MASSKAASVWRRNFVGMAGTSDVGCAGDQRRGGDGWRGWDVSGSEAKGERSGDGQDRGDRCHKGAALSCDLASRLNTGFSY